MRIKNIALPFCLITLVSVIISCEEDYSDFGRNILPSSDNIEVLADSSIEIKAVPVKTDSVYSSFVTTGMTGKFTEEIFGSSTATFLSQVVPTQNIAIEGNPAFESVYLKLGIIDYYGEPSDQMEIKVYEMITNEESGKKGLSMGSNYYSNDHPENYFAQQVEIGKVIITPEDDLTLSDTVRDELKINLSESFGRKILTMADSILLSDTLFKKHVGGIKIEALPVNPSAKGSIIRFATSDTITEIEIQFTNVINDEPVDGVYEITLNSQLNANMNLFDLDYAGSDVNELINNSETNDSLVYIQSMGGIQTKLTFSGLDHLKSPDIVINNAELIITPDTTGYYTKRYGPPSRLWISSSSSSEGEELMNETNHIFLGLNRVDGNYDKNKNHYVINIPVIISEMLNDEDGHDEFYLFSAIKMTNQTLGDAIFPNHMSPKSTLIKGPGVENGIKLRITYTYTH